MKYQKAFSSDESYELKSGINYELIVGSTLSAYNCLKRSMHKHVQGKKEYTYSILGVFRLVSSELTEDFLFSILITDRRVGIPNHDLKG